MVYVIRHSQRHFEGRISVSRCTVSAVFLDFHLPGESVAEVLLLSSTVVVLIIVIIVVIVVVEQY